MIPDKYSMSYLVCTLVAGLLFSQSVNADNSKSPHSTDQLTAENKELCLSCHIKEPALKLSVSSGRHVLPDMDDYRKSENEMCTDCHGEENSSHIIGVTPDYSVPADLPLDAKDQVTCLTCHYIHGSLESDKPMASSSFMDHLFNRERLSKSYTLRRNNSEGDLCLACHGQ